MKKKSQKILDLESIVKSTQDQLKKQRKLLAFAKQHAAFLDTLNCRVSVYSDTLDFDYPSHSDSVRIMEHFRAGTWTKQYSETKVTYRGEVDGMLLRMYEGALPPYCKLVTETVVVPAHMVPERTETKTRIVCNDENLDQPTTEAASA